ncbi:zinc finger MYM-type protein 1-like [Myzus persicae]|nr:zinc finger MYM-type protein 1-like [Myzus persicae]
MQTPTKSSHDLSHLMLRNMCTETESPSLSIESSASDKITVMFDDDPGKWPKLIPNGLKGYFLNLGVCQPSPMELSNWQFPKTNDSHGSVRCFHEKYYFKTQSCGEIIKRSWLSYSSSLDKVFCTTCKIFGLPKAQKLTIASDGTGDYRNIKRNIENHESCNDHIQSVLSRALYESHNRIDAQIIQGSNIQVSENREILRVIIDSLIFMARQNIALRGHDESTFSTNQGNFLELIKMFAKYHPTLQHHLNTIEQHKRNRLTFLSHDTQNKLLSILSNIVRSKILSEVKKAGIFSVIIDTTTDVSKLEQFCLVVRYVFDGETYERLLALTTTQDASGFGMFQVFCNITENNNLNWKEHLCAQGYDGAASMQGVYSGLRTHIQNHNPRAVYIWCFAHVLNLVIVDTCDICLETRNFFGDVQALN